MSRTYKKNWSERDPNGVRPKKRDKSFPMTENWYVYALDNLERENELEREASGENLLHPPVKDYK